MGLVSYVRRNFVNGPGGGTPLNATNLNAIDSQVKDLTDWALALAPKITVSALSGGPPASPSDFDIWIATGVDSSGCRWMFQYNAGSSSAYKWEFLGGGFLYAEDNGTLMSTTSAAFVEADSACRVPLPRAGDYEVIFSCGRLGSVVAGVLVQAAVAVAASPTTTAAIVAEARNSAGAGDFRSGCGGSVRMNGRSASDIICQALRNGSADGSTCYLSFRKLSVRPVRIA